MTTRQNSKNKNTSTVNYTELVEFIGEKFEFINEKFELVNEKFERTNQAIRDMKHQLRVELTDELGGQIGELKGMFNTLQTSVDKKVYREKTTTQEIVMINSQIKRHDRWIHEVADKVKVDLPSD